MGGQRLHPLLRRVAARRRPPGRRLRSAAIVPARPGGLHGRLHDRRHGRLLRRAGGGTGPPGHRGGHVDARHFGHRDHDLPRADRASPGHRHLGGGGGVGPRRRSGHRRHAHPARVVALDLLRERSDRSPHAGTRSRGGAGRRGTFVSTPRRRRHLRLHHGAVRTDLRPDRGAPRRVDVSGHRWIVGSGRRGRPGLRADRAHGGRSRWWTSRSSPRAASRAAWWS